MKKTKKIILIGVIGVILLGCICSPLFLGSKGILGGGIFSSVNEEWNKTEINIKIDEIYSEHCYSGNDGDYIKNISFSNFFSSDEIDISYGLYFNIFDDLEVYFVFDNGYTTPIETSHTLVGGDYITIDGETALQYDLANARIVEVWIRTID